jgi:hypothetical protein
MVRARVSEAIRRLAGLGFVELLPEDRMRLRSSLMRFAEPVRGSGADLEALARLVASGEVALTENDEADSADDDETESSNADSPLNPQSSPLPEWNEGSEWGASFDSAELDPALRPLPKPESESETETETETALADAEESPS